MNAIDLSEYYLTMTLDERMFNVDPWILGEWSDDPQYIPIENSTKYFFKVRSEKMASKLVRLFEKRIKPSVDTDGDTKVRVDFACHSASGLDEDERFLADEEIESLRTAVDKAHMDWRVEHGLRIDGESPGIVTAGSDLLDQRPALTGYLLASERLYDQAQRWQEKLDAGLPSSETGDANPAKPPIQNQVTATPGKELLGATTPTTDEQEGRDELQPFTGGEMVFSRDPDRIELCGADICSGPRSTTRRIVLELLSMKRRDGSFVTYGMRKLTKQAKELGAKGSATAWIRDLRADIEKRVLNPASISGDGKAVILSGRLGYRLEDRISVRFVGDPKYVDITDTDDGSDVPNDDVPNDDVPNDAFGERRTWILQQLKNKVKLKGPDVVKKFGCDKKTVQRDLGPLLEEGVIEYFGNKRTGYYRLRRPNKTGE